MQTGFVCLLTFAIIRTPADAQSFNADTSRLYFITEGPLLAVSPCFCIGSGYLLVGFLFVDRIAFERCDTALPTAENPSFTVCLALKPLDYS